MIIHNPTLTGSLTLNNVNLSTGNLVTTGSNTFVGNQILSGSLTVSGSVSATGTLTAQTLVVQTVTSSVLYSSGSNIFGNNIANTQTFTGSVLITGSIGINATASIPGTSLTIQGSQGAVILNNPTATTYTGFRIYNDQSSSVRALEIDYAGSSYPSALVTSGITGESAAIVTTGAYPIQFGTSNTFRMAILANGRVGIGTTSPTVSLTVQSDTADTISWRSPSYTVGILGLDTNNAHGAIFLYSSGSQTVQISAKPGAYTFFNGTNVGIGTSSPLSELHVMGTTTRITITNTSYPTSYRTILGNKTTAAGVLQLGNNGDNYIVGGNQATGGDLRFFVNASSDFITSNNGTEAMRITSAGVVLINTTSVNGISGAGSLQVNKEIISLGSSALLGVQARDASTFYAFYGNNSTYMYFYNTLGGNETGQFTRSTGAYTALSDVNKKKDFEASTLGLNAILGLKPTLYRMKEDDETSDKHLGLIAQEVKEFIPQAYVEDGGFIGLTDRPIIATLVKAIQELSAKNDDLQAQITELKNK